MATIKRFEDLNAWKLSKAVCEKIGCIIDSGALKHNFRLIGQIEGSSGSVMDNIAEGFERGSRAEFIVFLGYSKGSCGELRSQLYRMLDRKYIIQEQYNELQKMVLRISMMLQKFIEYLIKTKIQGERKKSV
ncbi:MAG: four helix bundle protein [Ferruginibacter sp.]